MKKLLLILSVCFIFLIYVPASASDDVVTIKTPHAVVMEVSTGKILFQKAAEEKVHPASVTKLMTVFLALEAIDQHKISLTDQIVTSAYAKSMGGSQVYLEEGESQTVETMLKCILIASGNDAAVAMAEHIAGSEAGFVNLMNEKAEKLGMKNTHFMDCCGLTDSKDHYMSAGDVALLSRELLLRYPQVVEYSGIWIDDITHVTAKGSVPFTLSNTNKLLRAYQGCDGLKTGSTSYAGYCLSATACRNDIRLISVVMKSQDSKLRFKEAAFLLDYGFAKCTRYTDDAPPELPEIHVRFSGTDKIKIKYADRFSYLSTEKEDFSRIKKELFLKEELKAPIKAGESVGKCIYSLGNKKIGSIDITVCENVERIKYPECLYRILKYYTGAGL